MATFSVPAPESHLHLPAPSTLTQEFLSTMHTPHSGKNSDKFHFLHFPSFQRSISSDVQCPLWTGVPQPHRDLPRTQLSLPGVLSPQRHPGAVGSGAVREACTSSTAVSLQHPAIKVRAGFTSIINQSSILCHPLMGPTVFPDFA